MKTLPPGSTRALSLLLGLVIGALFSSSLMAADCTSANITLSSQTEVDNFQIAYGGEGTCDTVTGNLKIGGNDIVDLSPLSALIKLGGFAINGNAALTNLDGLSALTSVDEHLNIWGGNDALNNIDGLSALTSVGGNLEIGYNASLTNIDGLSALTGVLESLNIRGNDTLTNLDGLSALTHIGDIVIEDNASLTNINGLSAMTGVGRWFFISGNAALANLDGLSALTRVNGIFVIGNNASLTNLDGLSALTRVNSVLSISNNAALTNIEGLSALNNVGGDLEVGNNAALGNLDGLATLYSVGGDVNIGNNTSLTNLFDLSALTIVGGHLNIWDNAALTKLGYLSVLTRVGGWLYISGNATLANLDGLSALTRVEGSLRLRNNAALANLDGLSALTSVWMDVRVNNNHSLAACTGLIGLLDHVDDDAPGPGPGAAGIPDVFNNVDLSDNLPGCNSVTEIFADAPLMKINVGLNDVWYNPETPGQGFLVIVFPEIEQVFMAWFTYDTERPTADVTALLGDPGHRWLTAQGVYEENVAALDVYVTTGGVFDSYPPEPVTESDGEIMLEFSTCNAGTVTYDIPSIDRQGVVPIERITFDNVPLCYLLNFEAAEVATKQ